MRKANGQPSDNSTWDWHLIPIGGGGYTMGLGGQAIHPTSGYLWVGTDVFNSYVRKPGDAAWSSLFRTDTIPTVDANTQNDSALVDGYGSYMGAWAPSDTSRLYSAHNGWVYTFDIDTTKSLNANGAIVGTRWNLGVKRFKTNASLQRWWSPRICVHPTDKNTVLLGTDNDGCYYTTNAGSTVGTISVPAALDYAFVGGYAGTWSTDWSEQNHAPYLVWIDQGNASYWYVLVGGIGLHRSTNGAAGPFTLVSGGPLGCANLLGEADGTLWIVGDCRFTTTRTGAGTELDPYVYHQGTDGGLYKLARGSGTTITQVGSHIINSGTMYPFHVAIDPFNNQNMVVFEEAAGAFSTDRGATWSDIISSKRVASSDGIAWRFGDGSGSWSPGGGLCPDPLVEGRVWGADGFGISYSLSSPFASISTVSDASAGIEEVIMTSAKTHPTTDRTILTCWDIAALPVNSFTLYQNNGKFGNVENQFLERADSCDFSCDDPDFWVVAQSADNHAYSTDNGNTFHKLSGWPSVSSYGGQIACGNKNNIVLANNQGIYYTKDGAAGSFTKVALNGTTDYGTNYANLCDRVMLSADKTRPGTFAVVQHMDVTQGHGALSPTERGGLWVTTDGGDTWVQKQKGIVGDYADRSYDAVNATSEDARQFWVCKLAYVPGRSGEMLYSPHSDGTVDPLFWFENDGLTQHRIPNVYNVWGFTFGKNVPGQAYPAVYFTAEYPTPGALGHYVTFDWFATIRPFSDLHINRLIGSLNHPVGGSMATFGKMIHGYSGGATSWTQYQDVRHAT